MARKWINESKPDEILIVTRLKKIKISYIAYLRTILDKSFKNVKFKTAIILVMLSIIVPSTVVAQLSSAKKARAMQKAVYFWNFAQGCDWPDEHRSGNFVIGIYGDNELFTALIKGYSSLKRGSQPFKIVEINEVSQINGCHMLYVDETKKNVLESKRKALKSSATLIITNQKGILNEGSMINFVYPTPLTEFEVSKSNASKSKLVIGKDISSMAVAVR